MELAPSQNGMLQFAEPIRAPEIKQLKQTVNGQLKAGQA
jgi:hypothetical protein